jgi:L-seryl-tRNA(Ser) seleniumtransferase
VTGAVFKTVVAEHLGQAGSIPVRLRQRTGADRTGGRVGQAETRDVRRTVPRTDRVLADPALQEAAGRLGRDVVKDGVRTAQERVRRGELDAEDVVPAVLGALPPHATTMRPVINATGVLVHTNLGRAALSDAARRALAVAAGTTDVELDLRTGRRGARGAGARSALLDAVPTAEDAHVVNNNAAALALLATAHAGAEVVVSRGELVEIGDGFRIPELLVSAGVTLREVGTTNRVRLEDYAAAVGPGTAFVLKVHPSNFVVSGFTGAVGVPELSRLDVPLVVDVGSGLLAPHPRLPDEPDCTTALRQGADLVTASGDKLLGGPQCGLVLGLHALVHTLRRHPVARAMRVDKLTLAALEATLRGPAPPVRQYLDADPATLRARARSLARELADLPVPVEAVDTTAAVGGGGAPGVPLPSAALALPADLTPRLREGTPGVLGHVQHDRLLLDLLAVDPREDAALAAAVRAASRG